MIQNKFVFIVPVRNCGKTLKRSLLSAAYQTYDNGKIVVYDDSSSEEEWSQEVEAFNEVKKFVDAQDEKMIIKKTGSHHIGTVENVLRMIYEQTEQDDIVCRLDGDDWLTESDALFFINTIYNQRNIDAMWTAHRWSFTDANISGRLPDCKSFLRKEKFFGEMFRT